MFYPVHVHPGDETHAHGATIPDFPGCFSAADHWEKLPAMVQEAVETWCEGETTELPSPTPLEVTVTHPKHDVPVGTLRSILKQAGLKL